MEMVRMSEQTVERSYRIVVGIDTAAGSTTALRWAVQQAKLIDAKIEAVSAWHHPSATGFAMGWGVVPPPEQEDPRAMNEQLLAETVAEVVDGVDPQVSVSTRVIEGDATHVLLEAACGADLLVVGGREHGVLAGLLRGSVSEHCVQHAPCPVVVIPQ